MELGQSATTLSGGEAQRVKISSELYRRHREEDHLPFGRADDRPPLRGRRKLIEILQTLVNHGNTVVVIEHNMDVIKSADYLIDIGPDGGVGGGKIVASGTPEEVAKTERLLHGRISEKRLERAKKCPDLGAS